MNVFKFSVYESIFSFFVLTVSQIEMIEGVLFIPVLSQL